MQAEELFKILNEKGAQYVVVGAFAMASYGYSRPTHNLNLWVAPTEENMARARDALSLFGYDLTEHPVPKMLQHNTQLTDYWMDAIIHPQLKGATFATVWKNKVVKKIEQVMVPFVSLDDLIRLKRAMKRKIDKEDLKKLTALKKKGRSFG